MSESSEDEVLQSTCILCRKVLKQAQTSGDMTYIKDLEGKEITLEYIGSSAQNGCRLCQLFLASTVYKGDQPSSLNSIDIDHHLSTLEKSYKGLEVAFGVQYYVPSPSNPHKLESILNMKLVAHLVDESGEGNAYTHNFVLQAAASGKSLNSLNLLVMLILEDDAGPPSITLRRSFDRASECGMRLAKQWLSTCQEQHIFCPKLSDPVLPDRIIEILPGKGSEQDLTARLTCGNGALGQYAALSYVWGGPQTVVTTTQNIQSHYLILPFSRLGTTIQDAIRVTHGLGLRYLWVDSLCIMQDSKADKAQQISQMKRIFESSFVTIIAASAATASVGFLRQSSTPSSLQLPYWYDGSWGVVELKERWAWDSRSEVINSRAWTLEEKLLSPRKLIYSSHHMSWECRSETLYDPSSADQRREAYPLALSKLWAVTSPNSLSELNTENQDREDILNEWREVVTWYTGREMTEEADKLRAIAGLAESFQTPIKVLWPSDQCSYFAGFWLDDFPQGLLWYRRRLTDIGSVLTRPRRSRAPSWSWASINGQVVDFQSLKKKQLDGSYERLWYNSESTVRSLSELLHIHVESTVPSFPYGQVKDGALQLRGYLKRESQFKLENGSSARNGSHLVNLCLSPGETTKWFYSPDGTLEDLETHDSIWLLALHEQWLPVGYEPTSTGCIWSSSPKFVGNWIRVEGIIICPVSEGMYQRVGHFQCWDQDSEKIMNGFNEVTLTLK